MGVTALAASRGRRPGAVHSPALLHLLLLLLLLGHRGRAGECKGHRQELSQQPGYVTDGPGNYSVSGNCEWLIRAPNSSFRIILTFMFLDTECAYDYLFIYDGDSYSSPLLASLSGNTLPEPIEARSGKMLLHLFSDANYNLLGFNATYAFTLCPRGCSGHGTCDLSGSCTCHFGWSGAACNIQNCSDTCGPYGHCVAAQHCQCQPGFIGHNCDLSLNDNQSAGSWYNVSRSDPEFTGRTAAAGTFLNTTNSLYIFGGFDLNQVLGDLVRYNFTSNQWHRSTASPSPPARHSHSAVEWRGRMLIFGGQLANGSLLSDVWLYEAVPESWKLLSASTSLTPPGLASHAATLVDHYLYVYGGRTDVDRFSSRMFRFNLLNWIWEEVIPTGGKSPAMAAHSMVFHPASRTLLVFGGHRVSPRFSFRTNTTNIFHVDERYWTELRSTPFPSSPRERAFHTATIVGNYMVVYGGNVHIHYQEEKCYDGDIFFYHLDCHQWVSSEELRLSVSAGDGPQSQSFRGRYSHVAALMNGNILLVAGGYSGYPMGDLVAYKVPIFVSQVLVQNVHLDYCSLYRLEAACNKDPECVWCQAQCQSYQQHSPCPHVACLGLAKQLSDCQACLVFGQSWESLPQAPVSLGWCVQTSTCLPVTDQDSCRVDPFAGIAGWWGSDTTFITATQQCQRLNFQPGLHLVTYLNPPNISQPDKVVVTRRAVFVENPSVELEELMVFQGFVHPLFDSPSPSDSVVVKLQLQRLNVVAKIGRTANSLEMEEVGHWAGQPEKEIRLLQRNSGDRLFPILTRGSKYAIRLEGTLNNSGNGQTSEMTLTWERTNIVDTSEISFHFLEPFRTEDCDTYPSCLACLADQGCGWCPDTSTCHQRVLGIDGQCGRSRHLILTPGGCVLCKEHTDCPSCSRDPYCEWQVNVNRKGDFQCTRRGRSPRAIHSPAACPGPCHLRTSCRDCLSNSSQCAWCQSTGSCFLFTSYLAKYPAGQCRHWYDSVHSVSLCTDCSAFLSCKDCLQNFECGWCGNADNPTIGRCVPGDFRSLQEFVNCSVALSGLSNLTVREVAGWSYSSCPDIDECRLHMDNCNSFATCRNTFDSFECHCNRGYAGDGSSYCNQTCYNECRHGQCSGPPHYSCICELGWTSDMETVNETGVECDIDCGCHFHSTCRDGIGKCDQCMDWTMGQHCELCQPGSYGNATQKDGCQQCACNGHGASWLGDCDRATGRCFCTENTEGPHCEDCVAGYYGDPRENGRCYRECVGRVLLQNISSSALGSTRGQGLSAKGLAYCLWVLTTSNSLDSCEGQSGCLTVSLTIGPDIRVTCGQNYVYVFDGVPGFLSQPQQHSALYADPKLIGAFCGNGHTRAVKVDAVSGVLTVYFEANISRAAGTEGFNATYTISSCQPRCLENQRCQDGHCVCETGYSGENCTSSMCPNNCSSRTHNGHCHMDTGVCVCADGFAGSDCGTVVQSRNIVWETVTPPEHRPEDGGPLKRMGHSMVEGPGSTLWIYGGLSLRKGILNSVYRFSLSDRRWSAEVRPEGRAPRARYFHAAATSGPALDTMYVAGGLTDSGVASDFWLLDLANAEWTEGESGLLPPVTGHTLTLCRNSILLLIGGYSPQNGFNNKLLEYDIRSTNWSVRQHTGTAPTGLYGHSAVYHPATDAVYVFGGYRFYLESVSASRELYSLYLPGLSWSLLAPSHGAKPLAHFFHVSGLFRDTMVVVGGRTETEDFSAAILLYHINCNTWITVNQTGLAGLGEPMRPSVAPAAVAVKKKLYISGGYGGVLLPSMVTLRVPLDPCLIFSSPGECNSSSCVWCRSLHNGSCLSPDQAERYGCETASSLCEPLPRLPEDCRRLRTCSECLARHPRVIGQMQQLRCKWCTNCPEGACISSNSSCTKENDCRINQREIFVAGNCSEISCEASDCAKCTASGKCMWTRQFKRTGETRRILSVSPAYDWTCFSHSLRNVSPMPVESCPPEPCPRPCHTLTSCAECLSSNGSDGGWQQCVWSLALQQCMSPSFLPLRCAAGMCGRLLKGQRASCNLSCASYQQCSHCIRHSHCGWCATHGHNGIGRCIQGGLNGTQDDSSETCPASNGTWAFMSCPPENECLNGHHDCDDTQNCTDKLHGFECVCRNGYMQDSGLGLCKPVCEQGCVNGTCVQPNSCQCHFGYVGANCSVQCQCNQHSNCESVSARDRCLQCVNNTKGDHCEKCQPLYVGSAVAGGLCRPCSSFCNNNSHICIMREQYERAKANPEKYTLEPHKITGWLDEGPWEDNAVCVQCQNNSSGEHCESCLDGFFLLDGKCTKCQCNGHWDRCRVTDGTECQCQNNTETSCPTAQTDKRDCYKYQCARCKENFLGNPTNGRQCYRQITVEQEYCFDPTSQSNCYHEPNIKNLPLGRSVLFAVQPKFTNVDIRITIDVTFGGVDIYISNSHSAFTVSVDPGTGFHRVLVGDPEARREAPSLRRKRAAVHNASVALPEGLERVREERAEGLTTYVTVGSRYTVLVVRAVRERLVVTYPYELHALKTQRFFMVLLGVGNGETGESQGLLFFRQDQAHIDLFVFFSVFFSCFFLFLSVCVLLWKLKQFVNFQQEHRRHIQEMNKMASRPFAHLAVYLEPDPELLLLPLRHQLGHRLKAHRSPDGSLLPQLLGLAQPGFRVGPITLEPTDDGMAAVATLMCQLPGGPLAPNRACLGSALVTIRHNLQEYCSSAYGASNSRKVGGGGGISHDNLTSMSM